MKDKILIVLIVILTVALFVETAYLLQIKYDKAQSPDISLKSNLYNPFNKFWYQNPLSIEKDLDILELFNEMEKIFKDGFLFRYNQNFFDINNFLKQDFDIQETNKEYIVTIDIPEMEKEKINVEVEGSSLIISAENKIEKEEKDRNGFYKKEQSFGSFKKIVPLPGQVNANKVKTEYKDGVLIVILPKAEESNVTEKAKIKVEV